MANPEAATTIQQQNERQYRVIDQMMTMHAVLRDRYGRRATCLSSGLLASAVAMNAFIFSSDDVLARVFVGQPSSARIAMGIVSVILLVLAIVGFRVDWAARGRSHAHAVERLGRLKASFRDAYDPERGPELETARALSKEFVRTMEDLPPIPEKAFNSLKACHLYKRLLSTEVAKHEGVPVLLLQAHLRCQRIWSWLRSRRTRQDADPAPRQN